MLKNIFSFGLGMLVAAAMGIGTLPLMAQWSDTKETTIAVENLGSFTDPYMIPAAAFHADGRDPDSIHFSFLNGTLSGTNDNYGCVYAPVYFPDQAFPRQIFISAYDNDDANDIVVVLRKVDNETGIHSAMAYVGTSGLASANGVKVISQYIDPEFVSANHTYYVTTCLGSNQVSLYSVRVYYIPEIIYVPLISR